jgi:hypothetical protein
MDYPICDSILFFVGLIHLRDKMEWSPSRLRLKQETPLNTGINRSNLHPQEQTLATEILFVHINSLLFVAIVALEIKDFGANLLGQF